MDSFHRDPSGHNSLRQHGFASEWAETAARRVLGEVETPNEDNIVSFLTLALFWYSSGNWRRSHIHKGLLAGPSDPTTARAEGIL